ncbi:MAG: sugar ABC transporter ATP-binding protein [Planctomycetota bacterium]|nr:sugar ABC transporter ATP-binding protein [Planctomycetota bacterium]
MESTPMNRAADGEADAPLLEMRDITKIFPGVTALDRVNLTVKRGEIHVLLGENGAGKSTLIKTIVGINRPEGGDIWWQGDKIGVATVQEAYDLGIAVIYQELNNIPCLSVVENLYLGKEKKRNGVFIDWREARRCARIALGRVGLENLDVDLPMEKLGMGHRQLIEIARAVDHDAKFIIMDEPTSSLSRGEIDSLLNLMTRLNGMGIAILFITHKLDEARKVGHVVTVLRDGRNSGPTQDISRVSEDDIIRLMVGRTIEEKYPKRVSGIGDELFRCENLCASKFDDISFGVRRGELFGIFGLVGAGRTEVARGIFGADPLLAGRIFVEGREIRVRAPRDAIDSGIVLITENRKEEGLVLMHSVVENVTIVTLRQFVKGPLLSNSSRRGKVRELGERLRLRPLHPEKNVADFSGGNQQKIVVMKWLLSGAKVFIFDEPTKGVDVGAKVEIYAIMNQLLAEGAAIVMISSEIPEILGMSDRVMTMYEGIQSAVFANDGTLTQERILTMATGGKTGE